MAAIAHANWIVDTLSNLMGDDERPPDWMWAFDDEMEIWFDRVKERRDAKYGRSGRDDDNSEMMQNELSERFRRV